MSTNPSAKKQRARLALAALALMLAGVSLLISSPRASLAQQDRQLTQTGPTNTTPSKRIALVIGNGTYTSAPPLKNPPNDARDMAATLKVLGFSVSSAIDADQRTMKRLIREFGQQLKGGGQGLFYYAGHGVQMRGRNYLIPANADITSETDVEDQAVDLNLVLGLMDEAQNGLNIVILDACRNNPFTRSFRSAGNGLAQVDAPTGTLIAYATSPGRVASDGQGRNGLYTSELLSQMRVTGISVEEMFKRVRGGVQRQTAGQQVPWESSSLVGSFYFASPSAETNATGNDSSGERRMAVDPLAFELSYWESIKSSPDPEDFKSYLEKYPNGQFASLAKNRIANLDAPAKPVESRAAPTNDSATDLAFWESVKGSTSADDFRAYLKKFPNGTFADLAKNRLSVLEKDENAKRATDEIAKKTLSFPGAYGYKLGGGQWFVEGNLVVSPGKIEFRPTTTNKSIFEGYVFSTTLEGNASLTCAQVGSAIPDEIFIREIDCSPSKKYKCRFKAESAAAASDALAAMKFACANPSANFPGAPANNSAAGNSLEGTAWKGDSAGGDKHYEFQFLANGEVVWHLGWTRLKNPTSRGTWRQTGNTVHMDFPQGSPVGEYSVEAIISGDKMSGSWNFGSATVRWDNGMYKFTIEKVP